MTPFGLLWRFARPHRKAGAASIALAFAASLLAGLLPLSAKGLLDFAVPGRSPASVQAFLAERGLGFLSALVGAALGSVEGLVVISLAVGLAAGLADLGQRWLGLRFQQGLALDLQRSLFDHLLRFPLSFFREGRTGYLVGRVTGDAESLEYAFTQGVARTAGDLVRTAVGVSILVALSPRLALATVALLSLLPVLNAVFAGRLREVSRDEREGSAQVSRHLQEIVAGVEMVKSHGGEEREAGRVTGSVRGLLRTRLRWAALELAFSHSSRGLGFLLTLVVMWLGGLQMRAGNMSAGDYVTFSASALALAAAVRSLSMTHLSLQPLAASLERIGELFSLVPEDPPGCRGERPPTIGGEVRFEEVTFSYGSGPPALHGVSLRVAPGEVVALSGPSGSGKTTLVNLLLKFWTPGEGRVSLDGRDLRELDTGWLREQVGVVSQDVFLFDDTVAANIAYGRPGAGRPAIVEAARRARIHEEILALPDGYDTRVGERGVLLSAGQRQRVSIARAFLRDPPILVLDEPTSALDAAAERLVHQSLRELASGRTVLIISHGEAVEDLADRVFRLDGGRVIGEPRAGRGRAAGVGGIAGGPSGE